jgi:hypothetical protein
MPRHPPLRFILRPSALRLRCGSCRSRTCQARCQAPRFSRPVPAPMGSELPRIKEHDGNRTRVNRGCSSAADHRLRAQANLLWARQDSNLRSPWGARFTVWYDRRSATRPKLRIASYGSRTRADASTGRHAKPLHQRGHYHQTQPNQGERGNRTLATTFTASGAATTPSSPTSAEEEGLEPSPPVTRRPRLANACDETDIRLSSEPAHAPARNRTWISSFARSRGCPFHHGDLASSASARSRTRTTAFEAPHDLHFTTEACLISHLPGRDRTGNAELEAPSDRPFHHGDPSHKPVAGIEPATRPYEGRVIPTSPIGRVAPQRKRPRDLCGSRGRWPSENWTRHSRQPIPEIPPTTIAPQRQPAKATHVVAAITAMRKARAV